MRKQTRITPVLDNLVKQGGVLKCLLEIQHVLHPLLNIIPNLEDFSPLDEENLRLWKLHKNSKFTSISQLFTRLIY